MIRPHQLVYRPQRSSSPWCTALAIAGAVALFASISHYAHQRTTVRALEESGAVRSRANLALRPQQGPGAAGADRGQLARAASIIDELSLPWDRLFSAIEAASLDRVALLAVQPDRDRRRVTLTAEAKDYADVLTYVARLKARSDTLTDVVLVSHEVRGDHPQRPVLFSVSAGWGTTP